MQAQWETWDLIKKYSSDLSGKGPTFRMKRPELKIEKNKQPNEQKT